MVFDMNFSLTVLKSCVSGLALAAVAFSSHAAVPVEARAHFPTCQAEFMSGGADEFRPERVEWSKDHVTLVLPEMTEVPKMLALDREGNFEMLNPRIRHTGDGVAYTVTSPQRTIALRLGRLQTIVLIRQRACVDNNLMT
ncbi:hypothetical protein [Paraburkholderia sp. J8-2]|uniref:hypothetical protein n=1 Tax=Paraburkholderia sp. J8-2 TaxID=2805440 RepID=UPI002AB7C4EB|nr:hypothetical protein [Paraburkholderia sp. J8-2]